jgi:hypothetical protein
LQAASARSKGRRRKRPERYALATLYCVLMSDYCLDCARRRRAAVVVVEGSFTGNPWFAPLLAALRPQQRISIPTMPAAPPAAAGCCRALAECRSIDYIGQIS